MLFFNDFRYLSFAFLGTLQAPILPAEMEEQKLVLLYKPLFFGLSGLHLFPQVISVVCYCLEEGWKAMALFLHPGHK